MIINVSKWDPVEVGKEYLVVRSVYVVDHRGTYLLKETSFSKKWHGNESGFPCYLEKFGVRKVISTGPGRGWNQTRVVLSDDLYPDHP